MDYEKYENKKQYPMRTEFDTAEDFRAAQVEYGAETGRLEAQFRADLEEEFGMKDHPKANKLYWYAYQQGHGSGYSDVYLYYSDFVDLVK